VSTKNIWKANLPCNPPYLDHCPNFEIATSRLAAVRHNDNKIYWLPATSNELPAFTIPHSPFTIHKYKKMARRKETARPTKIEIYKFLRQFIVV
jgi:hypothetical protein